MARRSGLAWSKAILMPGVGGWVGGWGEEKEEDFVEYLSTYLWLGPSLPRR